MSEKHSGNSNKKTRGRYAQKHAAPRGKKNSAKEKRTNNKKSTQSRANQKKTPSKAKRVLITIGAVVVVAALCVTAGLVIINVDREIRKNSPFAFSQGVSISGIDISEMSYSDALKKLKKNSMSVVKDYDVTVEANGKSYEFDKESFSYKFKYKKALKEAKIYSLKEQGIYEGTESTENTEESVTQDTEGNIDFTLEYTIKKKSVEKVANKVAKKVDKDPVNAKVSKFTPFSDNKFEYKEGEEGYQTDSSALYLDLLDFFDSNKRKTSITAQVSVLEPEITASDVKENITALSTATSTSTNTANGNNNMKVALEACNGSVIEPGDVWSFNNCTGDSNLESNGYKSAAVISEKKIEEGIGGGICQASTTIFKAALFANMTVVERHNHYWASSYAYSGEDATIDYPNLDLRLQNSTEYQMFIECKMEGTTLTVNIYGYQSPDYDDVKLVSKNKDIEEGESYKTVTRRILYLDGKVVKKEVVCNSTYSLTDGYSVRSADDGTYRSSSS